MPETASSSMKIKSYFADSVEEAIQEARGELGAEAMLITSRRSSAENRTLGAYEVVLGLSAPAARPRPSAARPTELSSELEKLRMQLEEIKSTLQGARSAEPGSGEANALFEELVANDLARGVAREIVSSAARLRDHLSAAQASPHPLRAYAAELISKKLRFAPPFSKSSAGDTGHFVVFTGPPGAGKTTTLVKIAVREFLAQRQPVRILSLDPGRVAAHEKLRSLAAVIGVSFTSLNSVQEFLGAAEDVRGFSSNRGFVLVDTPGYSAAELDGAAEVARCLERLPHKQTHLVLPASMKRADLTRMIGDYGVFQPDYLLFAKLDETRSLGAMLSAALESDKPLSFFANGQSIPEDLEPAQARAIVASMFRPELPKINPQGEAGAAA
jgi:flagellar biosynthesis protein FlhF